MAERAATNWRRSTGSIEESSRLPNVASGAQLVILDTLTAVWPEDEESNAAIAAFDREVLQRLVRETRCSVIVLDHTGHLQPKATRKGVSAARGASSKGQKADVVLTFKVKKGRFVIEHGKNRFGGRTEPPCQFRVVDTDDGGLDIGEVGLSTDEKIEAIEAPWVR